MPRGYLTKDAGGEEIVRAVQNVLSGEAGLAPGIQLRLLERLSQAEVRARLRHRPSRPTG